MPTRDEKVAQIEAALRGRFFANVPKVVKAGREGWTEDQHDLDRLSRALAAYALVGRCEIDDTTAAGAITDGSDDGGIDALYFDRTGNRLVLVQSKFKRTGTAPAQEEVLKTINGVKALRARQFNNFNLAIRNRLDEIEEAFDTPGVRLEVLLVFLGDAIGPHATDDLNAYRDELNQFTQVMDWQATGLEPVFGWLIAEQAPAAVDDQITLENWSGITTPRKAFYGQISAAALAKLVEDNGKALFERNIRHYLGSVGVNTAIEKTVRTRPGDFFYLNNGITAVAETITPAAGTSQRCAFGFKKLSIVNGAQTAGAIFNATLAGNVSPDAKLLVTLIEIGNGADDIGLKITRARNHQNVVRGVDFAALDPNQERLRQELAAAGITYFYRPSAEARARREDAFTLEEAAVAMACLAFKVRSAAELLQHPRPINAVDFVVTAKKEIGRLWEQDGTLYGQLFPATLSGVRACRLVRIYRFIDRILADTERSENSYYRRMFFRHGRYFIMAFVALRSGDVMSKSQLEITAADETLLSQRTNELSELIYSATEPLQTLKGYLAIFRNLTDAQPLAASVLQRLAEDDARRLATQQLQGAPQGVQAADTEKRN
ncbi:AIPR family protein [Accumulibacter sp.]|uniref:AIPR family protein n=1 Tax=Accumulibacter sp. TaxID=2053492 RepID=UPI0025E7FFDE|nr:AIPR family protein [Accumulibacter sp.]MCM8611877.1 AIPR family protein [Accumulibacter sp.]MCM8635499.1 AIPR family protein [Accumulibacter sp.]MCM8639077.1 AIPR family protein [Accumulibacter sp.]